MTSAPEISVVVCTHNRAAMLHRALTSVLEQESGDIDFEILAVDNRSTDETAAVVRRLEGRGPLRYLHEPALGLSSARNHGWRSARGRYVAYLDDDAVADPGWLRAIHAAFTAWPRAGAIGGRVEPIWEAAPPVWLSSETARSLSLVDWSRTPQELKDLGTQWLAGANFALPRELLQRIGGFSLRLGRTGTRLLSNEEVHLQKRVLELGRPVLYYPEMVVRHRIPRTRLTKSWLLRRFYWQGISDVAMQFVDAKPKRRERLLAAARLTSALLQSRYRRHHLLLRTDDAQIFYKKCCVFADLGRIAGLLGAAGL